MAYADHAVIWQPSSVCRSLLFVDPPCSQRRAAAAAAAGGGAPATKETKAEEPPAAKRARGGRKPAVPSAAPAAAAKAAPAAGVAAEERGEGPAYFLMKSEPDVFSIDDLAKMPDQTEHWDGALTAACLCRGAGLHFALQLL